MKNLMLPAMLAILITSGCKMTGGDPPCLKSSIKKYDNGKVTECELTANYKVGEITCAAKTKLQIRDDGSLKSCDLAEPVEVQGFPCKSGTLSFDDKGKVYFCSTTSKEIKIGDVTVPAGSLINPFGSGKVKFAECKETPAKYKELSCRDLTFNDAGKLTKCRLAADTNWKGRAMKTGTMVDIGPND